MTLPQEPDVGVMHLAQQIHRLLAEGIHLSSECRHYINSTFSHPTTDELIAILADEQHPERDSLIELIFFPDEAFQRRLEPLLEAFSFDESDEMALKAFLRSHSLTTTICWHQGDSLIHLCMPNEAVDSFVARLHICYCLPPLVAESIRHYLTFEMVWIVRVRFRNSGVFLSDAKERFWGEFFQQLPLAGEEDLVRFDYVLSLLTEADEGESTYSFLMHRRAMLWRTLQQATRFEQARRSNNMETLLLGGMRVPHVHRADIYQQIGWIDTICLALFGRIEPLPTEWKDAVCERIDSIADLHRLTTRLG